MNKRIPPGRQALPPDLAEFLSALHAALALPLPAMTPEATMVHGVQLRTRCDEARIMLAGVLAGDDPARATAQLQGWVASSPIRYEPLSEADGRFLAGSQLTTGAGDVLALVGTANGLPVYALMDNPADSSMPPFLAAAAADLVGQFDRGSAVTL